MYPRSYKLSKDGTTQIQEGPPVVMAFHEFSKRDNLPRFKSKPLRADKGQEEKLKRPFAALFWAAGFSFSEGNLIKECGYSDEIDDVFFGEELF